MILIFSRAGDVSTNLVIDWLNYYSYSYMRINISETYSSSLFIDINNQNIYFDNNPVPIDKVGVIWYRKFGIRWASALDKQHIKAPLIEMLGNEYNTALETLLFILKDKKWLTHPEKVKLNKCKVLIEAQNVGLSIPMTFITNSLNPIKDRLNSKEKLIIKSVYDMMMIKSKTDTYNMFTKEITMKDMKILPNTFFPSLVQHKIEKAFEIRAFYINSQIYAAALFSQLDKQTSVDSRIINIKKPMRTVPYQLDSEDVKKIIMLMQNLGLNCGSLDLIKANDGELYFLEVNPVGEFGQMGYLCNYELHKIIATELIKMDKL